MKAFEGDAMADDAEGNYDDEALTPKKKDPIEEYFTNLATTWGVVAAIIIGILAMLLYLAFIFSFIAYFKSRIQNLVLNNTTLDHIGFSSTQRMRDLLWLYISNALVLMFTMEMCIRDRLFGAIAVMYFAGYTFNSMTLLALLLLIGIVVDDAIVVRESILRHMSGEIGTALPLADQNNPQAIRRFRTQATINGSQEVVFAVLASTAALVCIFAPVIFMEGMMGKFFKSFAVVVTFGVLVSLLVSLTLTPMLCACLLYTSRCV